MEPEERMEICKACPLYKESTLGPRCDSHRYISPDGKEASWLPKAGWKRGCNCYLNWKTKAPNQHCIIGKW